mgnify:FL=1
MKPIFRSYQKEEDYWRIREFLREVFLLNNCYERSWHVARLDYTRQHILLNCTKLHLDDVAYIGEVEGKIAAFIVADGDMGEAHFSVHPSFRTPELEEEMLKVAEEHLSEEINGSRSLRLWAVDSDKLRESILEKHGYSKQSWAECQWRCKLDQPIPKAQVAPGYTVRSLGDGLELLERCYASGLGFHEGDIKYAIENRDDITWYRNIQRAPLYRRDLDLIAVAPDGSIVAFCTIWFDDVTRSGYFEPVATVPKYRRLGLAQAVMTEGLHRLQQMGATTAFVGGFSQAANSLYERVMGPEHELYVPWEKKW